MADPGRPKEPAVFSEALSRRAAAVEEALHRLLPPADTYPPVIHDAMRYGTLGGGKRLRGALVLAGAGAVGGVEEAALPVAAAVEMIHAFSLIHDDLPCMDDDDVRRGKPTCHRVYGEAVAVLAGDALLARAFGVLAGLPAQTGVAADVALRIVEELARAAGSTGLIGGQVVDLESEGAADVDEEVLHYIHTRKTGALFSASLVSGGLVGGASEEQLAALRDYGRLFGLAFQITDDLLDVLGSGETLGKPVGSDARQEKVTYVSVYGVEGARERARRTADDARRVLRRLPDNDATRFLSQLLDFVLERDH